jgi:hypothetical protein
MIGPSLIQGDVAYLPLTKGLFAKVDAADFERLMQWKWCARVGRHAYAVRRQGGGVVYLHRQIAGEPAGLVVDHINRDTLDCRSCNLRKATVSQNNVNCRKRTGCTSRFKGVGWDRRERCWAAFGKRSGKQVRLGRFDGETEAAQAYDNFAMANFGEFAVLNFHA